MAVKCALNPLPERPREVRGATVKGPLECLQAFCTAVLFIYTTDYDAIPTKTILHPLAFKQMC